MLDYRRVNLHFPMGFPFSYGFSYVFPMSFVAISNEKTPWPSPSVPQVTVGESTTSVAAGEDLAHGSRWDQGVGGASDVG